MEKCIDNLQKKPFEMYFWVLQTHPKILCKRVRPICSWEIFCPWPLFCDLYFQIIFTEGFLKMIRNRDLDQKFLHISDLVKKVSKGFEQKLASFGLKTQFKVQK